MRIHSDILTRGDILRATWTRGMTGVDAQTSGHGSRIRRQATEVKLTGTSNRRPNPGAGGREDDGSRAATWDEWGMVLAELFAIDPHALAGSASYAVYNGAADFHRKTGDRFRTLQAADQHRSHRWDFDASVGGHACKCGATQSR